MPNTRGDLPDTVARSSAKAQRTYAKALESAHEQYESEEIAHRTAYAALKHTYERVGDHWERKAHKGPSDPRARQSAREARRHPKKAYGGVDFEGHTKGELYERAKRLDIEGRSTMNKGELAEAIASRQ